MAVFGFLFEYKNKEATQFIKDTNKRLQSADLVTNPFKGFALLFENKSEKIGVAVISMKPVVIPFSFPNIMSYLMMSKGMKKAGYKGKMKLLGSKELIKYLVVETWDKTKF